MDSSEIRKRLADFFDPKFIKFKPQAVKGNRAMAVPYLDARAVEWRLDAVLGVDGWKDNYKVLPSGSVVCRLSVKIDGEWVSKMDVGSPSEQPDEGDRMKAAFSDALKRAAVKFGIGRYLYRLPMQWCDYDPQKRQFVQHPALPKWAVPAPNQDQPPGREVGGRQATDQPPPPGLVPKPSQPSGREVAKPPSSQPAKTPPKTNGQVNHLPTNGTDLFKRMAAFEVRLVQEGLCEKGDLIAHIRTWGADQGYPAAVELWSGGALQAAPDEARAFEAACRKRSLCITPEQKAEIGRMVGGETKVLWDILERFQAQTLDDLPKVHFQAAKEALEKRREAATMARR
jgi:hypothetical protein